MKMVCRHDPNDPSHLICEYTRSPIAEWFTRRKARHYCVGPKCPPRKAYGHLVADVFLTLIVAGLVVGNIVFLVRGRSLGVPTTIDEQTAALRRLPLHAVTERQEVLPALQPGTLELSAAALYFTDEGEQVGRGPHPPRVGETTAYKVSLRITATHQPFDRVVAQGTLARNAQWTGFVPQGRMVSFDEATRVVRWDVGSAEIGLTGAVFEVALTPAEDQVGERVVLLDRVTASARDRATKTEYRVYAPAVVTDVVVAK